VTPFYFCLILISLASFVTGQLLLKHGMESTAARGFRQPTFVAFVFGGTVAMAISFFLTLGLLQKFDLSYIDPFQGLSVIFVSLAAIIFLREKINLRLALGSLLISAGLVLVSLS
jgi:uncharacterized membrane protein